MKSVKCKIGILWGDQVGETCLMAFCVFWEQELILFCLVLYSQEMQSASWLSPPEDPSSCIRRAFFLDYGCLAWLVM